jgi:hypothetical protein
MDSSFSRKLLLRFRGFRHPGGRSRREREQGGFLLPQE